LLLCFSDVIPGYDHRARHRVPPLSLSHSRSVPSPLVCFPCIQPRSAVFLSLAFGRVSCDNDPVRSSLSLPLVFVSFPSGFGFSAPSFLQFRGRPVVIVFLRRFGLDEVASFFVDIPFKSLRFRFFVFPWLLFRCVSPFSACLAVSRFSLRRGRVGAVLDRSFFLFFPGLMFFFLRGPFLLFAVRVVRP